MIVPFTGDQPFWGQAIYRQGFGPPPCEVRNVTAEILVVAITKYLFNPEVQMRVHLVSAQLCAEDGVGTGVDSFHRHLPAL